jgi:hypothetical protein
MVFTSVNGFARHGIFDVSFIQGVKPMRRFSHIVFLISAMAFIPGFLSCTLPWHRESFEQIVDKRKPVTRELPSALPFPVARRDTRATLSDEEVETFTRKLVSVLRRRDFFTWVLRTSHGMDSTVNPNDFSVWWTGFEVEKKGGEITFRARAGKTPDNIMIPTAKVLGQAAAAYLLTGDAAAGAVVKKYGRGVRAQFKGMVWNGNDTVSSIMARAVIPASHRAVCPDGRRKYIDYSAWQRPTADWNSQTI